MENNRFLLILDRYRSSFSSAATADTEALSGWPERTT